MKLTPITLPPQYAQRISPEIAARIIGVGETALLAQSLLGFIASRECPGDVLIETVDRVPEWVKAGRVIVSGFHSPLEQQVLRSVLRRKGRVIKVLARGINTKSGDYYPTEQEREPLTAGRMLVMTACPPETSTTRESALARNRLVLALASDVVAPYISPNSPLKDLIEGKLAATI